MRKRYDEVRRCESIRRAGPPRGSTLALRRLYHDRAEVTGCILCADVGRVC